MHWEKRQCIYLNQKNEMRAQHTKRLGKGFRERGFREASRINLDRVWAAHRRSDPHNRWVGELSARDVMPMMRAQCHEESGAQRCVVTRHMDNTFQRWSRSSTAD